MNWMCVRATFASWALATALRRFSLLADRLPSSRRQKGSALVTRIIHVSRLAIHMIWSLSLVWSGVSCACRRASPFSCRPRKGTKRRPPGPVARTVKPCGYASDGRVRLTAHPCTDSRIRAIPRASRKRLIRPPLADRNGIQRQRHPTQSGGQRSSCRVLLTFNPFKGGEVAQEKPVGWPEWIRASSLSAQG